MKMNPLNYFSTNSTVDTIEFNQMSRPGDTLLQPLIKTEYKPVSSSRKLNLLLQRSVRYSYRQRCCSCCPTILCELLFPLIIIAILILGRYGINRLAEELNSTGDQGLGPFQQRPCSQSLNTTPTSSNDLFKKCFKFPPRFGGGRFGPSPFYEISNRTNLVFEPMRDDINAVVKRARERLAILKCSETTVW